MVENNVAVLVWFFDHEVGKKLIVYGNVEEVKLDQFETNEDSWITVSDSYRTLNIPKVDVTRLTILKKGEDSYRNNKEVVFSLKKSYDREREVWLKESLRDLIDLIEQKQVLRVSVEEILNKFYESTKKDTIG